MKNEMFFAYFILLFFILGVAFGFTSKILWQYKSFVIAVIAGYVGWIISKKAIIGIFVAVMAYFVVGMIL